jgi:hypothetical protein
VDDSRVRREENNETAAVSVEAGVKASFDRPSNVISVIGSRTKRQWHDTDAL